MVVQLNLDLNALIQMEQLTRDSTVEDLSKLGLGPLYDLLQTGLVVMTAAGVNEAKETHISKKHAAYELFCELFWKSHKTDKKATYRTPQSDSPLDQRNFWGLTDAERYFYGHFYVAMLLIQDIKKNHALTPIKQFESYLSGMISMVDRLHAFEIEIAKFAFWSPTSREIESFSPKLKQIYKDMKNNFYRKKGGKKSFAAHCMNAAMDISWLGSAAMSEEMGADIEIDGVTFKVEQWLATTDQKLHRLSKEYHHIREKDSNTKHFANYRDDEMDSYAYWREVDELSSRISRQRSIRIAKEIESEQKLYNEDPNEYRLYWRNKENLSLKKVEAAARNLEISLDGKLS
jgi:hypothetical protein